MGMDVYGRKPSSESGKYFRANIWSWRPIHKLCEQVMDNEYPGWGYNEGAGFLSQGECDILADRLENYLNKNPKDEISIESDCRVNEKGVFLNSKTDGRSAYHTTHEHVRGFIIFLRSCGGFEIC